MEMRSIDSCFICTTPLQIINAVSIAYHNKKTADLYIIPQFSGAEAYYKRLSDLNIFCKVIYVKTDTIETYKKKKGIVKKLGIVRNYLRIEKVGEMILVPDTEYQVVYISSKANIGRLVCLYMIRKKKNTTFCFFDDGEGSYYNLDLYRPQRIDRLIRQMLFGNRSIVLSNQIYLYSEDLYRRLNPNSSFQVRKLPSWQNEPELCGMINHICGYTKDKAISQRMIIIDTLCEEVFNKETCDRYRKIRKQICSMLGSEVIMKKHPRDHEKTKRACYPYSDIPFEVLCANNDIERKILICVSSTAVVMPKILFDKEPIVIMLYKITSPKDSGDVSRYAFCDEVRARYRDKERFIVPTSEQELFQVLERFIKH